MRLSVWKRFVTLFAILTAVIATFSHRYEVAYGEETLSELATDAELLQALLSGTIEISTGVVPPEEGDQEPAEALRVNLECGQTYVREIPAYETSISIHCNDPLSKELCIRRAKEACAQHLQDHIDSNIPELICNRRNCPSEDACKPNIVAAAARDLEDVEYRPGERHDTTYGHWQRMSCSLPKQVAKLSCSTCETRCIDGSGRTSGPDCETCALRMCNGTSCPAFCEKVQRFVYEETCCGPI